MRNYLDEMKTGNHTAFKGLGARNPVSESEHQLWNEQEQEDDDWMKLVIWKVYQRDGALDAAILENHEGMKEELDAIEWICPQFLQVAANIFHQESCPRRVGRGYTVVVT